MHQTMKKALAVLLTLCLLLGVIPMGASAALLDGEDYISQNMSLGADLVLNLYGNVPESYLDGATATLNYANGTSETMTVTELTQTDSGAYLIPVTMNVAEMNDDVNLVLKAKVLGITSEAINETYSIRNYLVNIIEGDYNEMTKNLCYELLNMGAMAQKYFDYNTDAPANADYEIDPANAVPAENPVPSCTGAVSGITFYGASVRFLSKTAVRFYFKADAADGCTFTIGDTQYTPVEKDGMYYIETPGINPQDMSNEITVEVTDGTDTLSVAYAPMWYFIRKYNNSSDETAKNMMAAAYSYYTEAADYTSDICMDIEITTLGNSTEPVEIGFYPNNFEGDINDYTDKVTVTAGTTTTVRLEQGKYLVDGDLPGIGFAVFGGPTWDAKLEDGVTPDRHNITISNIRLEGAEERLIDMDYATVASGNDGTGYTNANGAGVATIANGTVSVANGYCYDGHMITFNEPSLYVTMDVLFTTLSNSTDDIVLGFLPYGYEGDISDCEARATVKAGTATKVKLNFELLAVDGEFSGMGIVVFGGPEWNTQISDGVYDRHSIEVSNICLEGDLNLSVDLSAATVKTGFANANAAGNAAITDEKLIVSDGFRYNGYMINFAGEDETETTEPEITEPETEETGSYLSFDLLFTTLGNSTDPVEIGFFPSDFEGDINNWTDKVTVTAGTTSTVTLDASGYMVDGSISGIGIAIFGGPTWDAKLSDGYTPDRHTVTISNARLEGAQTMAFDLSKSVVTSGTNGTGYTNANGSGVASVADGALVISGGFCYDGHKISLVEDTNTYICMDMLFTTLGNSTDPVEIGFFPSDFEGDINNWTDKVTVTAGTSAAVKLDASNYMVDGSISGIGFAIFGGPTWDAKLSDGYTPDRHTVTISNARLEGAQTMAFDLSKSVVTSGTNGTGYTNANGSGVAAVADGALVISGGFCYDGHKISLVEDTNTYICLDMKIATKDGDWADQIEVGFCPVSMEGDINDMPDRKTVNAEQTVTIKLNAETYLTDGVFNGLGFAIFGGPQWNTLADDGSYDRTTITISNVRLVGAQNQSFDLSNVTWARGSEAGYTTGNTNGVVTIADGIVVITDGFCYDAHKFTF